MTAGLPKRPDLLVFSSVRELYGHFERLFLAGDRVSHQFTSVCGHRVTVFDHNFFHMVKLRNPGRSGIMLMSQEKETILSIFDGFGPYEYDRQRAIYLASAAECLLSADEVWEDQALKTARWMYIKEFDAFPYAFTILLVGQRPGGAVPVTSFPAKKRDTRKWRRGKQIYPTNTNAIP